MRSLILIAALTACPLWSCASAAGDEADPAPPVDAPTLTPVEALRAAAAELAERPEHDAGRVTVQHLLVSFGGAGTRATRSRDEAERLAADLLQRTQAGEDFDQLVRDHTDDSHPGIYAMVLSNARPPESYPRSGMVPAFGNTGWRLAVGETGVAAFDPATSPYGWHLVRRLE